jgi:hypothetical protein
MIGANGGSIPVGLLAVSSDNSRGIVCVTLSISWPPVCRTRSATRSQYESWRAMAVQRECMWSDRLLRNSTTRTIPKTLISARRALCSVGKLHIAIPSQCLSAIRRHPSRAAGDHASGSRVTRRYRRQFQGLHSMLFDLRMTKFHNIRWRNPCGPHLPEPAWQTARADERRSTAIMAIARFDTTEAL